MKKELTIFEKIAGYGGVIDMTTKAVSSASKTTGVAGKIAGKRPLSSGGNVNSQKRRMTGSRQVGNAMNDQRAIQSKINALPKRTGMLGSLGNFAKKQAIRNPKSKLWNGLSQDVA